MKSMSSRIGASLLFAFLLGASPASASLLGDEVTCTGFRSTINPTLGRCGLPGVTPGFDLDSTATIGAGADFQIYTFSGAPQIAIDIDSDSILLSNVLGMTPSFGEFGLIEFSDLDWTGATAGRIVGFELATNGITANPSPTSDGTTLTMSDVAFGDDFLAINIQHTTWAVDAEVRITLLTDPGHGGGGTNPIPEPSAGLVYLAGLGLASGLGRRQTS